MSRTALWERAVSYAAVGATQAPDLMQFPPEGYRPVERRARIGHGDARFEFAWVAAMSWGIQRGSGFRIRHADRPGGQPEHVLYGPDGTELLMPGDTVELVIPLGPFGVRAPARVVYVVDEPTRKGFAYGTLPGHPEDGEEAFVVDQRDDGSVWITIRAFSRPANRFWWTVYPVLRLVQEYYTRRYLRALAVPID
ncbi:MAG: DUF1990 domain-containing protein [Rhodoglobus sp.]